MVEITTNRIVSGERIALVNCVGTALVASGCVLYDIIDTGTGRVLYEDVLAGLVPYVFSDIIRDGL